MIKMYKIENSFICICTGALPCRGYMQSGLELRQSWRSWKHMLSAEALQQGYQIRRQTPWSQRHRRHMRGELVPFACMQVLACSRKGCNDTNHVRNSQNAATLFNAQYVPLLIVTAIGWETTKSAHTICNIGAPVRN